MAERVENLNVKAVMDVVKIRATNVVTFLHSGLSEVYSGTDRAQIESIRVLLNLKFFVRAVERSGSANIAAIHFKKWLDSAKLLQTDLIIRIPMEEVRMQFRRFLRKLEELAPPSTTWRTRKFSACSCTQATATLRGLRQCWLS